MYLLRCKAVASKLYDCPAFPLVGHRLEEAFIPSLDHMVTDHNDSVFPLLGRSLLARRVNSFLPSCLHNYLPPNLKLTQNSVSSLNGTAASWIFAAILAPSSHSPYVFHASTSF